MVSIYVTKGYMSRSGADYTDIILAESDSEAEKAASEIWHEQASSHGEDECDCDYCQGYDDEESECQGEGVELESDFSVTKYTPENWKELDRLYGNDPILDDTEHAEIFTKEFGGLPLGYYQDLLGIIESSIAHINQSMVSNRARVRQYRLDIERLEDTNIKLALESKNQTDRFNLLSLKIEQMK